MVTSVKSRKLSQKVKRLRPDRLFDPTIWKRAAQIARHYLIVVQENDEVGGYLGRGVEFPNVMSDGVTPEECIASTREALTLAVATTLEDGAIPPLPASDERPEQVNIRLSALEKLVLEETARARGYRGISDFMRASALASVR